MRLYHIGYEYVVRRAGAQNAAESARKYRSSRHLRLNACSHHHGDQRSADRSGTARSGGDRDINEIRKRYDERDQ